MRIPLPPVLQPTNEMLTLIAAIDEFKGEWRALGSLGPETLRFLRRIATIESAGSSTRIEGAKLSDAEVEKLRDAFARAPDLESRKKIAAELDDLNSKLSFAVGERPASADETLRLRPFSPDADRDIFATRTDEVGAAGDGSGSPASALDDEISWARDRLKAEEAAWFIAIDGEDKVGMVFGELDGGEVNVRIWIHPEHRKKGYGTAALRRSRSELAAAFPAVPLVVRDPGAGR